MIADISGCRRVKNASAETVAGISLCRCALNASQNTEGAEMTKIAAVAAAIVLTFPIVAALLWQAARIVA